MRHCSLFLSLSPSFSFCFHLISPSSSMRLDAGEKNGGKDCAECTLRTHLGGASLIKRHSLCLVFLSLHLFPLVLSSTPSLSLALLPVSIHLPAFIHPPHRWVITEQRKGRILIFNWFIEGLRVSTALFLPVEVLLFWHHIISCHYGPRPEREGNASRGLGLWKLHKYTFETQSCVVELKLACLWHNVKCFISAYISVAFNLSNPSQTSWHLIAPPAKGAKTFTFWLPKNRSLLKRMVLYMHLWFLYENKKKGSSDFFKCSSKDCSLKGLLGEPTKWKI